MGSIDLFEFEFSIVPILSSQQVQEFTLLIIPPEKLENSILDNILESYIAREGTDYGEFELDLAQKMEILRPQVKKGEVLIVYDEELESLTLMTRAEYQENKWLIFQNGNNFRLSQYGVDRCV